MCLSCIDFHSTIPAHLRNLPHTDECANIELVNMSCAIPSAVASYYLSTPLIQRSVRCLCPRGITIRKDMANAIPLLSITRSSRDGSTQC